MIKSATGYLFSSKTMLLWIAIFAFALIAIIFASAVLIIWGKDIGPYLDKLFDVFTWGGAGGTARNVISDGVAPRIPQAVAAVKEPSVAVQAPQPMQARPQPVALPPVDYIATGAPSSVVPQ